MHHVYYLLLLNFIICGDDVASNKEYHFFSHLIFLILVIKVVYLITLGKEKRCKGSDYIQIGTNI